MTFHTLSNVQLTSRLGRQWTWQISVSRLDRGDFTEVTLYFPADDGDGFFRVRIEK